MRKIVRRTVQQRALGMVTMLTLLGAVCLSATILIGCGSHNDSGPDVMTKKFPGSGAANGGTTPAPATK